MKFPASAAINLEKLLIQQLFQVAAEAGNFIYLSPASEAGDKYIKEVAKTQPG